MEQVLLTGVAPCTEVEGGGDGEGDTTTVALAVEVTEATEALEMFGFGSEPKKCSPHQDEAFPCWTALP